MRDVATLLEALPYIREFHGETVVIKYGGAAMTDPELKEEFARDVVLLKYVGLNPVVVHGGGPDITRYMERLGMEVKFVDGLRVSDEATVEVAKMVLVGKQNKDIVLRINRHGQPAVGLCGDDGLLFTVGKQLAAGDTDIGFVGQIEQVDANVLLHIAEDYIPVVASVGADREGSSYNVNADAAAAAVAQALGAFKVIFLTDVEGWRADPDDPATRISEATAAEVRERLPEVSGGMRPKLEACVQRARVRGGERAHRRRPAAALAAARAVHRRGDRDQAVALMNTYARYPVEFVRGEGTRLWDDEGNEYLDFLCGISVSLLGHCHPAVVEAVRDQAGRLIHVGNLFHTEPPRRLAERLAELSLGGAVFFTNSGAEAIECALKLARKRRRGGDFVVLERGFHGRTYGALSATPQEAKQAPFAPLVPGFRAVPPDDPDALSAAVDDRTAAVIVEAVQGEGGIHPLESGLLEAARAACDEHGALLICDEIQCGLGRTGQLWGFEHAGIRPDVMTLAKGLGGGLPIGACVAAPEVADVLVPGDHGSTFAGGPVVAAAANAVLDSLEDVRPGVRAKGERLRHRARGARAGRARDRADARLRDSRRTGARRARPDRAAPRAQRDRPGHGAAAAAAQRERRGPRRGRQPPRRAGLTCRPACAGVANSRDVPHAGLMFSRQPLVGVSTSEVRSPGDRELVSQGEPARTELALGERYLDAIRMAGGMPVILAPVQGDAVESLIGRLDAVCLSGGPDLHPSAYGALPHAELGPNGAGASTRSSSRWRAPPWPAGSRCLGSAAECRS